MSDVRAEPGRPILVYDGDCGFCARSVQFVVRHDYRRRTVRFAARDGVAGRAVRARHPELQAVDSLLWVEHDGQEERVRIRADAVLAVAAYLGGPWQALGAIGALVPRVVRDWLYGIVARLRKSLSGKAPACVILPPEAVARALD